MKKFIGRFFCFIGGITSLSLLLMIGIGVYQYQTRIKLPEQTVLTLTLEGPLSEGPRGMRLPLGLFEKHLSLYEIVKTVDFAALDPHVKGLLVRVGEIQLGVAQIQELRACLHRFRATGKFALVHSDGFGDMTSGTLPYYLATAFDEIALQPMGGLAFVGLSMDVPFIRRLLDEYDVLPRFSAREEYKGILDTFTQEQMPEASRAALQSLLTNLMSQIVTDIATEREIPAADLYQLVKEPPLSNSQRGVQLGLIDHVAYLDEFETYALKRAGPESGFFSFETYAALAFSKPMFKKASKKVALVFAQGDITRNNASSPQGLFSRGGISAHAFQETFEQIFDKDQEKPLAIVVRVNSPGGAPGPSESIWRLLKRARDHGVPVVVSMGDTAASGAYWIATAADKIVAQPGTITGSIGVAGGKVVLEKLWERLGVKWDTVTTGPHANSLSPHHDFTQPQWDTFQEHLDYTYSYFLKRVAQGRGLSPTQAHDSAKGRVWSGQDALRLGLVDALGDLSTAIDLAKKCAGLDGETPVHLVVYPRKQPWTTLLSSSFSDLVQMTGLMEAVQGFLTRFVNTLLSPAYKVS